MPRTQDQTELAPPGAGLPTLERLALRHLAMPLLCRTTSWTRANRRFTDEARRILDLAAPLDEERLCRPVLIRRVAGIEDSSRRWSVAMTMEHLIMVGRGILDRLEVLTHDRPAGGPVQIASFKPHGVLAAAAPEAFEAFAAEYVQSVETDLGDLDSRRTFPHPWFGPLTAHQWHCLAAAHQKLHRRQVQRIVQGLAAAG